MKIITLLILLFVQRPTLANAGEGSIRDFANDLERLFSIKAKRTLEVGDVTHFAPQIISNPNAEASYNPRLNTIFLKKENLIYQGEMTFKVKSITQLKSNEPLIYPIKVATIFHELGHSEMEQFILKGLTSEDRILSNIFKNEFTPWVKKNYPGVNAKYFFQEIYGYYRSNVIETLFQDKTTIEIYNGWNRYKHHCFNSPMITNLAKTLSRKDFGVILFPENISNWEEAYMNKFLPDIIFINGKDLDLMKNINNDPFKESWKKAFWDYFSNNYQGPANMRELATYFKTHHENRGEILKCRNELWDRLHAGNQD
jgi:hypothetical protein